MKKALVSPMEEVTDYLGNVGYRICQVENNPFDVAVPFFWTDCPDDCNKDIWWYYDNMCQIRPQPPEENNGITQ